MSRRRRPPPAEGYARDIKRFTLQRHPAPCLHDVMEHLEENSLVKAKDHNGEWFYLTSDQGLDQAIAAAKHHPVSLFYVIDDGRGESEDGDFSQCPRAWVNYMWSRQTTQTVPEYTPQRYSESDEQPETGNLAWSVARLGDTMRLGEKVGLPLTWHEKDMTPEENDNLVAYLKARNAMARDARDGTEHGPATVKMMLGNPWY